MYSIEFNNVWKKYRKGEKTYSLRDALPILMKKLFQQKIVNGELKKDEFWVIEDVNFKVKKGEVLGIIGPNGAGKSTILKLLSKILIPNKGKLYVKGRLSALIEVTAGFHPDFTGRENVYFNGAVLGMKKTEIDAKFEDIVEFSGVREFIDTPVKRYSSGMMARLGFAVAAHVDPEVLLVDEVLSVGDMTFQAKCTKKMRDMLDSGVTILFISHNMPLVQNLCQRVILLDKGKVIKEGLPDVVVPFYEDLVSTKREEELKSGISSEVVIDVKDRKIVEKFSVETLDENEVSKETFESNEKIRLRINYRVKGEIKNPVFCFEIHRADGVMCCESHTKADNVPIESIKGEGYVDVVIESMNLSPGVYFTKISIWDKDFIHPYASQKRGIFKIGSNPRSSFGFGVFLPNSKWIVAQKQIVREKH